MKTLLAICPGRNDATSLWRGLGPLLALKSDEWRIKIAEPHIDWVELAQCDAVFMQRPHSDEHVSLFNIVKNIGLKVWVDYDDDLLGVPPSNSAHNLYASSRTKGNIIGFLKHSDAVSVSTDWLAESFRVHADNKPISVIKNSWNDSLFKREPDTCQYNKTVFWRGSSTHDEDLDCHLDSIARIQTRFPDWTWIFFGSPFWKVRSVIPTNKLRIISGMHPLEYVSFCRKIGPTVAIVPLKDSSFNRSKSNIAWMESTYFGASVVCPDWPEWQNDGANLYHKNLDRAFEDAVASRTESVQKSWNVIKEKFWLSKANEQREQIMAGLT